MRSAGAAWSSRAVRALMLLLLACGAGARPTVLTSSGRLAGVSWGNTSAFLSVPFAAPPVGQLRWRPPAGVEAWNGTLDVGFVPKDSTCPQLLPVAGVPLFRGSEHRCLTLSVYAPSRAGPGDRLPVMVWLPGGGFIEGSELHGGLFNGTTFAERGNVIVVSVQYRIGSLGFLYSPDAAGVRGNLGLLDQRAGLRWVRDEIGAFGGDASRVTLFGESAGAISACVHLTAAASQGLFRAAIMESGVCASSAFYNEPKVAAAYGRSFIEHVGCGGHARAAPTLACLQGLPLDVACAPFLFPTSIAGAKPHSLPPLAPVMGWTPTLDGSAEGVPMMPIEAIRRQTPPTVPFIMGTNKQATLTPTLPLPLTLTLT